METILVISLAVQLKIKPSKVSLIFFVSFLMNLISYVNSFELCNSIYYKMRWYFSENKTEETEIH